MAQEIACIILLITLKSWDICSTEASALSSPGSIVRTRRDSPAATGSVPTSPAWRSEPDDRLLSRGTWLSWQCADVAHSVWTDSVLYRGSPVDWSYTWYKDNEVISAQNSAAGIHVDEDSGLLEINRVRKKRDARSDEGVYYCIARSAFGAFRSREAALEIISLEKFVEESREELQLGRAPGTSVLLKCRISGTPEPTITWYRNDQLLPQNSRYIQLDSGDLLIQGAEAADEGEYFCSASNQLKSRNSTPTTLVIFDRGQTTPSMLVTPEDKTISKGEDVSFICAASGYPLPRIQWTYPGCVNSGEEGVAVERRVCSSEAEHVRALACPDGSKIHITRTRLCSGPGDCDDELNREVLLQCEGIRECVLARYLDGQGTRMCGPGSEQSIVAYVCRCKDEPSRMVSANSRQADSGHLSIVNAHAGHAGAYTCTVTSEVDGSVLYSYNAVLSVLDNYEAARAVRSTDLHDRDTRTFSPVASQVVRLLCRYSGSPKPQVTWLKDGQEVTPNNRVQINDETKDQCDNKNYYCQDLFISKTELNDTGLYQCVVTNSKGSDSHLYYVNVVLNRNSPNPPTNLRGKVLDSSRVVLSWDAAKSTKDYPIIGYSVHFKITNSNRAEMQEVIDDNLNVTIKALQPFSNYTFYVVAYNSVGVSLNPKNITLMTDEAPCLKSPEIHVEPVASQSLMVTWDELSRSDAQGHVTYWKIEHREFKGLTETMLVPGHLYRARINGLNVGEKYEVRVICLTSAGLPESITDTQFPWVEATIPDPSDSTLHIYPNVTTVRVEWNQEKFQNRELSQLEIKYKLFKDNQGQTGGDAEWAIQNVSVDQSVSLIRNLEPDTQYELQLIVQWKDLSYPGTFAKKFWTLEVPTIPKPPIPTSLIVEGVTTHSMNISWRSSLLHAIYRVQYTPSHMYAGQNILNPEGAKQLIVEDVKRVSLTKLLPNKLYTMKVQAVVNGISSIWSTEVAWRTGESVPLAPTNLTLFAQSPGILEVKWSRPVREAGVLIHYNIYYRQHAGEEEWAKVMLLPNETRVTLRGLEKAMYDIQVCGESKVGQGDCALITAMADVVFITKTPMLGTVLICVFILFCVVAIIIGLCLCIKCNARCVRSGEAELKDRNMHQMGNGGHPDVCYANGHAGVSNGSVRPPILCTNDYTTPYDSFHIDTKGGRSPTQYKKRSKKSGSNKPAIQNGELHTRLLSNLNGDVNSRLINQNQAETQFGQSTSSRGDSLEMPRYAQTRDSRLAHHTGYGEHTQDGQRSPMLGLGRLSRSSPVEVHDSIHSSQSHLQDSSSRGLLATSESGATAETLCSTPSGAHIPPPPHHDASPPHQREFYPEQIDYDSAGSGDEEEDEESVADEKALQDYDLEDCGSICSIPEWQPVRNDRRPYAPTSNSSDSNERVIYGDGRCLPPLDNFYPAATAPPPPPPLVEGRAGHSSSRVAGAPRSLSNQNTSRGHMVYDHVTPTSGTALYAGGGGRGRQSPLPTPPPSPPASDDDGEISPATNISGTPPSSSSAVASRGTRFAPPYASSSIVTPPLSSQSLAGSTSTASRRPDSLPHVIDSSHAAAATSTAASLTPLSVTSSPLEGATDTEKAAPPAMTTKKYSPYMNGGPYAAAPHMNDTSPLVHKQAPLLPPQRNGFHKASHYMNGVSGGGYPTVDYKALNGHDNDDDGQSGVETTALLCNGHGPNVATLNDGAARLGTSQAH